VLEPALIQLRGAVAAPGWILPIGGAFAPGHPEPSKVTAHNWVAWLAALPADRSRMGTSMQHGADVGSVDGCRPAAAPKNSDERVGRTPAGVKELAGFGGRRRSARTA